MLLRRPPDAPPGSTYHGHPLRLARPPALAGLNPEVMPVQRHSSTISRAAPTLILSLIVAAFVAGCAETLGPPTSSATATASPTAAGASAAASPSAGSSATASGDVEVELEDFAFQPAELTIRVGTTVTFRNRDDAPHTATNGEDGFPADDPAFDIDLPARDSEGQFTFDEAGTYSVTCKIHPQMNMTITVEG